MKVYITKDKTNCGPCSFINLTGIKGNKKNEGRLAREGKLKPFKASSYILFLIGGNIFKKNLTVYTRSRKLNNKMFRLMFEYEKIPKGLHSEYKKLAIARFDRINKQFSAKVNSPGYPVTKIDSLLDSGHRVAILTSSFYFSESPIPHWIVAFKKDKNKYYFMCSKKGIVKLTKEQILKGFKINKKQGYYPVLVAYKK
jgi:hypothetical protein